MARGRTITVVLGGGRGSRLYPLTAERAKPAVPLAAKYRLIDIPLSNAINSGLRQIFVLTQFNSASLNAHIARTYRFDMFTSGFVEVLAAEQTDRKGDDWFQGTADAVRKHLHRFVREGVEHVVILSGDHLYRMRYDHLVSHHEEQGADITVAAIPVYRRECSGLGVIAPDAQGMVQRFQEKPADDEDLSALEVPGSLRRRWGTDREHLASMGVYVFRAGVLRELLEDDATMDFGRHILPGALRTHRVSAFLFEDYWEDIGTIQSFFDANLMLTEDDPPFRFYVPEAPIYTRARFLPPTIYRHAFIERSLVAEGCLLHGARVVHSTVGQRAWLLPGSRVEDSILMGADFYEVDETRQRVIEQGRIPVGIGEGASVKRAIIDKNARIGAGAVIHGDPGRGDEEHDAWCLRDGIIIVKKNATIEPGAVL
ncbi:MAG TPA: glucose-1-phosphate adenylyltransferase [Deltaproteobacteria bacterium]|nr:glucose-1-phosphate adenylyltransferase [Deltaproteobacteria bacterium]